jgi:hypothetical protein
MEEESAFHLLCDYPSLISLRMRKFLKPILGVEEYEGACASALLRFALASGFPVTFILMNISSFFFVLSISLFVYLSLL